MQDLEIINEYEDRLRAYNLAFNTIYFDHETIAPKGGNDYRFKCLDILMEEFYKVKTDEKVYEALLRLEKEELDEINKRRVKLLLKSFDELKKIPSDLYLKFSSLRTKSQTIWEEAKKTNNYKLYEPYLIELIKMSKQVYRYKNPDVEVYDQMLDDYEEGMNMELYDQFFNLIKEELVPLIKQIKDLDEINNNCLKGKFEIDKQRKVQTVIKDFMNFDSSWGYMSEYMHPFTSGFSTNDVRVTTFYREDDFTDAIFSSIHEIGHATYEHQMNKEYEGGILQNVSSGLHESQSRLYENMLARSYHFWDTLFPKIKEILNLDCTQEDFVKAINVSKPSLIRTQSDELTYPIHILIRYEMEKAIFKDNIDLKDLNKLWNKYYLDYLDIEVDSDTNGILQDVHWSDANFGYFPTYALGSAYAAQFMYYMQKNIDVDSLLSQGKLDVISTYLKEHIHKYSNTLEPKELVFKATGEYFNPKYYIDYLKDKYTKLYKLQ